MAAPLKPVAAEPDVFLAANDETKHEMIVRLLDQYRYDHVIAMRRASKIQRELSRAEHEMHRLERHIQRIEDFCKLHNIPLDSEQ